MTTDNNPFCPTCGFRTYPQWGPHECNALDTQRARHVAGDVITNLHFYRIPAEMQVYALCEALAFVLAANIHPATVHQKWRGLQHRIDELMQLQIARQQQQKQSENLVMDVVKSRLKAKKRRTREQPRSTKKTHR